MSRNFILVVDQDLNFAENAARLLRDQGYEVRVARDGSTALSTISAASKDLVFLDYHLADGKAGEIVDTLLNRSLNAPKIVLVNCDDEKIRAERLANQAVEFLSNPVENDALLRVVKNALKSKLPPREEGAFDHFASLEKFFPFLAHEIRNPLHAISGALTILEKRCDLKDEVVNHAVRIIKEEGEHLNGFVQECLDFVRPPAKSRLTEVDINEVAGVAINVVFYMFEDLSKKIQLTKDFDLNIPKVTGIYEDLKRAFLNILKNSFEAIGEDGKIHVQTKFLPDPSPGMVEISFSDNGMGVKKENLKDLFTPFFTTKLRGIGLGLAICSRIIAERHGGEISIQSEEGNGTTIKVQLPAGTKPQHSGGGMA
jgi:signal transduction histidine kinase